MKSRYGTIPNELLRTVAVVHEAGNFSKAAQELGITPAAISAQIKRLERLLGDEIFITSARGLKLSELGTLVEQYSRRILALNDQLLAHVGQTSGAPTIRLGLQSIFASVLMPRAIIDCEAAYPEGIVKIDCDTSPGLLSALTSGYQDAVFCLAPSSYRRRGLAEWTEHFDWVCAPTFDPKGGSALPLIMRASGYIDGLVIEALESTGVPYRIAYRAADLTTRTAIAVAGKGIMVLPTRVIPAELRVAPHSFLPKIPELRAGIFVSEGCDSNRTAPVMEAFAAAVAPPGVMRPQTVTRLTAASPDKRSRFK